MSDEAPRIEAIDVSDHLAPEGFVWICEECGKRARSYLNGGIDRGWDASCALNAVLVLEAEVEQLAAEAE